MASTILSWTGTDPRDSVMFTSWGVLYRFSTEQHLGKTITTLWRAIRQGKEDRVARLEWGQDGSYGRAIINRNTVPMADLVRKDAPSTSTFNGPDGYQYRWRPSPTSVDLLLLDPSNNVIAFFRPVRPARRYSVGDVHGELHFLDNGSGTVMHPPLMDMVCITALLNRLFAHAM